MWKHDSLEKTYAHSLDTEDRIQFLEKFPESDDLIIGMDIQGNERQQLYHVSENKEITRLTKVDDAIHVFGGISSDGHHVAWVSNERDARFYDVYTMNMNTKQLTRVLETDGTFRVLGWRPSGDELVIQEVYTNLYNRIGFLNIHTKDIRWLLDTDENSSFHSPKFSSDGQVIYVLSNYGRETTGLAQMDLETMKLTWLDEPDWDIENLTINPDKSKLAYTTNEGGIDKGWILNIHSGHRVSFELGFGTLADLAWNVANEIHLIYNAPTQPADVYVHYIDTGVSERLYCTLATSEFEAQLIEPEVYTVRSFDGRSIPSFLYKPKEYNKNTPVAFWVHGGPEGQTKATYHPVIQSLTSLGYVVCAPNVRGSKGYGKTYIHLDDVRKRMDSVKDLIEIAEALKEEPYVDEKKVAVIGRSYGGFLVLAAVTHYPHVFTAGIDLVGISSFRTFLENTGPWRRKLRESEYGTIEADGEFFDEIDPIHYSERITAPLMVSHGANDPRVPIAETEQIIEELRARNHPVEYIRFEDEGHGIVKIENQITAYTAMADFLQRLYNE
ncbi:alpha/beta fold hydrolase [Geomicrobium sp. JSM 1781026]|uniref:S9 family peptidase n=1 Tax=Geomicrobium sp. JSM 1781026 TaxID=3344580 RepID=UPI0035C19AC6